MKKIIPHIAVFIALTLFIIGGFSPILFVSEQEFTTRRNKLVEEQIQTQIAALPHTLTMSTEQLLQLKLWFDEMESAYRELSEVAWIRYRLNVAEKRFNHAKENIDRLIKEQPPQKSSNFHSLPTRKALDEWQKLTTTAPAK